MPILIAVYNQNKARVIRKSLNKEIELIIENSFSARFALNLPSFKKYKKGIITFRLVYLSSWLLALLNFGFIRKFNRNCTSM